MKRLFNNNFINIANQNRNSLYGIQGFSRSFSNHSVIMDNHPRFYRKFEIVGTVGLDKYINSNNIVIFQTSVNPNHGVGLVNYGPSVLNDLTNLSKKSNSGTKIHSSIVASDNFGFNYSDVQMVGYGITMSHGSKIRYNDFNIPNLHLPLTHLDNVIKAEKLQTFEDIDFFNRIPLLKGQIVNESTLFFDNNKGFFLSREDLIKNILSSSNFIKDYNMSLTFNDHSIIYQNRLNFKNSINVANSSSSTAFVNKSYSLGTGDYFETQNTNTFLFADVYCTVIIYSKSDLMGHDSMLSYDKSYSNNYNIPNNVFVSMKAHKEGLEQFVQKPIGHYMANKSMQVSFRTIHIVDDSFTDIEKREFIYNLLFEHSKYGSNLFNIQNDNFIYTHENILDLKMDSRYMWLHKGQSKFIKDDNIAVSVNNISADCSCSFDKSLD